MKDKYSFWSYMDLTANTMVFPDLPGFTISLNDAGEVDAHSGQIELTTRLFEMELDQQPIPEQTALVELVKQYPDVPFVLCTVYMASVRTANEYKSVRKNVTLDKWLHDEAENRGINFSQTLQEALQRILDVKEPQRVKVLKIANIRRKIGKTKKDVAAETGISLEHISFLEAGRRILTKKDLPLLAKALKCKESDLVGSPSDFHPNDIEVMAESLSKFGSFDGAYGTEDYKLEAFMMLLNDMWRWFRDFESARYIKQPTELIELFKRKMIRYILEDLNANMHGTRKFPFTIQGFSSPSVCMVELYDTNETQDGKYTVVLENIIGTSVTNDCETYIPAIVKQILEHNPNVSIIKKDAEGYLYPNMRFIERYMHSGEEIYHEIKIGNNNREPKWITTNLDLKSKFEEPESRTYRRIVRARELPDPFQRRPGTDRCIGKTGHCPIVTGAVPDQMNGCEKCRDIALTWKSREWLLGKIEEEEIRNYDSYAFEHRHPDLFTTLGQHFAGDNKEDTRSLYYFIRAYGGYSYRESVIDVNENQIGIGFTDGSHRTKIAQNMDLNIPVAWTTYNKIEAELLE